MCAQSTPPTHRQQRQRHMVKDRCQQTKPSPGSTAHFTFTLAFSLFPDRRRPCLPPMVSCFVLLSLRPPLSGLDGHHCRGESVFIHGHDRRPSPEKGEGGAGRKNNTYQSLELAGRVIASFSKNARTLPYTRVISATLSLNASRAGLG